MYSNKNVKNRRKAVMTYQRVLMLFIFILIAFIIYRTDWNQSNSMSAPPAGEVRVHFIDVGQGDAILVQCRNHAVLIDSGTHVAGSAVVQYIDELGISTLDYVIATHPHSDHIGGMAQVLDRFTVNNFWMPDVTNDVVAFENLLDAIERNDIEVTIAQAGDSISVGLILMQALAPGSGGHDNTNNYSIVLYMLHGDISFLFTGDAEAPSEREMLARWQHMDATVLKTGHHGSRTSSTDAFLDAVNPQIAVISVGAENQFNHPHPEVLERLGERDIFVMRTDELGTIVMATDGENLFLY